MSAPASAPPRATRDRLIDAAVQVVARQGLEAASVKAVAAQAGVTAGLLHYHFADKDELMVAALRRALEAYQARLRERRAERSSAEQLPGLIADARAATDTDADVFRLRLAFASRALSHPDLAPVIRELNAAGVEETAATLAAAAGRAEPNEVDRRVGATLKAAFDGIMLAWLNDPAFPFDAAAELLAEGAQVVLDLPPPA